MKEVRDLAAKAVVMGRRSRGPAAFQRERRRLVPCPEERTKLKLEITEELKRKDYVGDFLLQKQMKEVRDLAASALGIGRR